MRSPRKLSVGLLGAQNTVGRQGVCFPFLILQGNPDLLTLLKFRGQKPEPGYAASVCLQIGS